jgi:hypothetical protein
MVAATTAAADDNDDDDDYDDDDDDDDDDYYYYYECGAVGGMFAKGNRSIRRKPVPVSFCTPQILHDLTRARTCFSAMGSRRLTA